MALASQTEITTKRSINIGLATLLVSVPFLVITALLIFIDQTPQNIKNILLIFVGLPSIIAIVTTVFFYAGKYLLKIWYWWIPNWLTVYVGLPRWQAVTAYGVINILLGCIVTGSLITIVDRKILLYIATSIAIVSVAGMVRLWRVYNRTIDKKYPYLERLGEADKPTKRQSSWYASISTGDVREYLTYHRVAGNIPELPELDSLKAQLFACIQSYASLQQGSDTEDTRLSRELRASIMSQHISVTASNLRHVFLPSELELTHIGLVPNKQKDSSAIPVIGLIIYANLSEAVIDIKTENTPVIKHFKTPLYIEASILRGQPFVHKIEIQESELERSLIHKEISTFAEKTQLLYVPRLAAMLIPKAGLLASSGVIRKWSLASNFMTGHTEQHAYFLLSIQPYIRYHRDATYVIGCTVIPKTHDRIIVADKRSKLYTHAELLPIQRVSTESSDFSARYGIFIGQESAVPSLELLNPVFMQKLQDTPLEVSIEVVGRQIFVYLPVNHVAIADFSVVLDIMHSIHKELRL